jgi:hypothetical protein
MLVGLIQTDPASIVLGRPRSSGHEQEVHLNACPAGHVGQSQREPNRLNGGICRSKARPTEMVRSDAGRSIQWESMVGCHRPPGIDLMGKKP